jgi:hypothetical protein
VIELLDRLDEAEVAFLDEIGERQAAVRVLLRDADDEPEVRVDQCLLRELRVGPLSGDDARDLDLVVAARGEGSLPSSSNTC